MGTNYYARRIPTAKRKKDINEFINLHMPSKEELMEDVNNHRLKSAISKVENFQYDFEHYVREEGSDIHLGKSSCGWQFLWQYYGGLYYKDNLQSIKEFLSSGEYEIYDEYEEKYTVESFFKEIEYKLYLKEGLWNNETYMRDNPPKNSYMYSFLGDEFTSDDGLRFCKRDFS